VAREPRDRGQEEGGLMSYGRVSLKCEPAPPQRNVRVSLYLFRIRIHILSPVSSTSRALRPSPLPPPVGGRG